MQNLRIRAMMACDIGAVAELWRDSWMSTRLGSANDPDLAGYHARLATEGRAWKIGLACRETEIFGFVAFEPEKSWLRQLFVKPAVQRAGIGAGLFAWAGEQMPGGFWLRTNINNIAARRFYERSGMRFDGEWQHPAFGHMMAVYRSP